MTRRERPGPDPREPTDPDPREPTDPAGAEPPAEHAAQPSWDPDGTDLARALLGRALGRAGPGPRRRGGVAGVARGPGSRRRARSRRPDEVQTWSGPGEDDRDPQGLDVAVERLVAERGWAPDLAVHGAIARWDVVVGPHVAAHVQPERFSDGELVVRAGSSAWATQMRHLAPTVIARLAEQLGVGVVQRLTVLGPAAPSWRRGPRSSPGRGPRDTYG